MIEVLFGESEAGSMKAAKSTVIAGRVNGPTEEVICLGFMLDIGDIKEPVDSQYRKNLIYSMYAQNQYGKSIEMEEELKQAGEVYSNELLRLEKYLEDGEAIRIWYSNAPYSRCGFYSLCRMLLNYKNDIHIVKLPEHVVRKTDIIAYTSGAKCRRRNLQDFSPVNAYWPMKRYGCMLTYGQSWLRITVLSEQ